MRHLCTAFLFLLLTVPLPAFAQFPNIEVPEQLDELHFKLGSWSGISKEYDSEGKLARERKMKLVVKLEHGGMLVHSFLYTEGRDEAIMRVWQYFDRYKKRLYDVTFDIAGHFERRQETRNDGKLAFEFPEPESFQDGVFRNWRKTYSGVEKDSFRWTWEYTEDGRKWTKRFVADFTRLPESS